jgi:hypothetical protein
MPDVVRGQSCDTGVSPGRALVPLTVVARSEALAATFRPDARFVTHLIATATHQPQTRPLRRAAPSDATTSYSVTSGSVDRPTPANGNALARVA